jgi:hypothetical protein
MHPNRKTTRPQNPPLTRRTVLASMPTSFPMVSAVVGGLEIKWTFCPFDSSLLWSPPCGFFVRLYRRPTMTPLVIGKALIQAPPPGLPIRHAAPGYER